MKGSFTLRRRVAILVAVTLWLPVFGDDSTDLLSQALDLVQQASSQIGNPAGDSHCIPLLTQAINLARQVPFHRLKNHRVLAIQDIRAALAEIQNGDPNQKAADDLRNAATELSASLSLAEAAEPAGTAPALSAPPSLPAPAPRVPDNAPPPPGVTPEMEQDFLAKYKAALEQQNPDAYMALIAVDPQLDGKAKEDLKGLELFGVAMTVSNPNRTYAFVPLAPGEQDKPEEFGGKMYRDYLPAVIALKITFATPANPPAGMAVGDTTLRLCVKDHQLMLVGPSEIPDAIPPPEKKPFNFGITPNLRKLPGGPDSFASLDDFLSSLKQPSLDIIASGETNLEYYAVCRIKPNRCVFAHDDLPGKSNFSFMVLATDANGQELTGEKTWIRLVDFPTDNGEAPEVEGAVLQVPDNYSGPITLEAQYWDDQGKKLPSFSRTVDWK